MDYDAEAFGIEVRRRRGNRSVRSLALAAGFSEGRWRQIENGYQAAGEVRIPVRPRVTTVVKIAEALGWPAGDALQHAGFERGETPVDPRPVGRSLEGAMDDLSDDEIERVRAYVQGIKDSRG